MRLVREYNQGLGQQQRTQEPQDLTRTTEQQQDITKPIVRQEIVNQPTSTNGANGFNPTRTPSKPVPNGSLDLETQEQIRELLAQGYRLSIEHANERRVRNNAWQSGAAFQGDEASAVITDLAELLAEHNGEYVRLIGFDPKAKRRVLEQIIQRPDGQPAAQSASKSANKSADTGSPNGSTPSTSKASSSRLSTEAVDQVRSLLAQGYKIGTEHADQRRFRTKSWHSCAPIESTRESEVIEALEACMDSHSGEYVRVIGIDPKAKRRVLETIIQKP
jgi:carbon dioxide concentrating mechanism protein CcmM